MARKRNYEYFDDAYRTIYAAGYSGWWEVQGYGPNSLQKAQKHLERRIQRYAFVPTGGAAVELGCGDAILSVALAKAGYRTTGIDLSPTVLRHARAQARRHGVEVRFLRRDATRLERVRGGAFDLVLDMNCLHCIVRPEHRAALLREARRLLAPEGVYYLTTMTTPMGASYAALLDEDRSLRSGQRFRVTKEIRGVPVTYDMPLVKRAVLPKQHVFGELRAAGLTPVRWQHRVTRTISDLFVWAIRDDADHVRPARRLT